MGISDVCSPVTRKGSKVASGQPMSPGARSAPGRVDQTEAPSAEPQLQRRDRAATHQEQPSAQPQPQPQRSDRRAAAHQEDPIPGSTSVTIGLEE